MSEIQLTDKPCGHILTNTAVWSPDGEWIVYDTRSDPAGDKFDGQTVEVVHVATREVREIYRAREGAHCGVATFHPTEPKVVFILGPEHPTPDWQYGAAHRQGVVVDTRQPGIAVPLDARDLIPPFTAGALRGGTHVHVFSPDGRLVSFTYDDHLLSTMAADAPTDADRNQRNVGISVTEHATLVPRTHPRNHDGSAFSVLVTQTVNDPTPGSDEIARAFEDAWVGVEGYIDLDGSRRRRAIAFQGEVRLVDGRVASEAFLVDLPDDLTASGERPLMGTAMHRPAPPLGARQRRLTYTHARRYPGIQGPRHWLRSSPDGANVALLMRDDAGLVQLWTISPNGGEPRQVSRFPFDIASAFSWHPDGSRVACVADGSVFTIDLDSGRAKRLTPAAPAACCPRPEACVFSPSGREIAYVRPISASNTIYNQIVMTPCD